MEIEGKVERPKIGEEVFIPANAVHTVRNVGQTNNIGITDTGQNDKKECRKLHFRKD